jgi:NAD(P)-dependent dehydrogenase (short-subunit alcohol dehydrogenase family)
MSDSIRGQVVLVTGAARGIGASVARELARRGARLALVGLEPERLALRTAELGPEHVWFECDVTDQAALERAVAGTLAAFGRLDVVIANAGIAGQGTVAGSSIEAMARTVEVNLIGVMRTVSATLEHVLAQRGYFLILSSAAAIVPVPGLAAYGATKVAVEHFAASLRIELEPRGVAVGVAHPSWIDTDLVRDFAADLPSFHDGLSRLPGPFGRVTSLDECTAALADAVSRRQRKVHVPRSLFWFALLRGLLWTRLGERLIAQQTSATLPRLEREAARLGRAFGASSVESRPAAQRVGASARSN